MSTGTLNAFSHSAFAGTSGSAVPAAASLTVARGTGTRSQPSSRARSAALSSPGPARL